VGGEISW